MENFKWKIERPRASIPQYQLWQIRVDLKTRKENGVVDDNGKYHALGEDERFEIHLDREKGTYEAIAVDAAKGTQRVLGIGPLSATPDAPKQPSSESDTLDLDTSVLNDLIRRCELPGALFGRDVSLTPDEVRQVEQIADAIDRKIAASVANDSALDEYNKIFSRLVSEGTAISGDFLKFRTIDGGEDATVREIEESGVPRIIVPSRVYNALYWQRNAQDLRSSLRQGKGTMAKYLAERLRRAAYFLRQVGAIPARAPHS